MTKPKEHQITFWNKDFILQIQFFYYLRYSTIRMLINKYFIKIKKIQFLKTKLI